MKTTITCAAALLAICFASWTPANASLSLFLDDGTTSFTVADGGLGDLDGVTNGSIIFNNMTATKIIPGFTSLFITSTSNAPGSAVFAGLNTTTLESLATQAKTLDVFISDMFSSPGVAGDSLFVLNSLTANHLAGGIASATQTTELDGAPTPVASVSVSSNVNNVNDTDQSTASLLRAGSTFTLETKLTTSVNPSTNVSFTSVSSAVIPEPTTIAVWSALGAIGLVAYRRRKTA